MAIGHVELNHAMTRIQDYTTQKHNEDQRGVVQQTHAQEKFSKELDKDIRQVIKTNQKEYQNKTQYQNKKFDARDKGSNQYTGDGGKNKKKNENLDGKVIAKQNAGFDIRI
ncbi:MAG: hypothetical protein IKW30_13480 [Lachnospiraceae bacterium]|nr:hypothetical protein [Lachnospiraceae bacterium]